MKKPSASQENLALCVCHKCSLFTECNQEKAEKLFCAKKKSDCAMDAKKPCICGMCEVFKNNQLTGGYFCLKEIVGG